LQTTSLNDRQLVKLIKLSSNRTEVQLALEELFNRYKPLINKYYYAMLKTVNHYDKDEFFQDAYIEFVKSIDYTALDKIRDDNWKFYTSFIFYIGNLKTNITRNIFRTMNTERSYNTMFEGEDSMGIESSSVLVDKRIDEDTINKILSIKALEPRMTTTDFEIANYMAEGYSTQGIMEALNITYYDVYKVRDKIKALLEE